MRCRRAGFFSDPFRQNALRCLLAAITVLFVPLPAQAQSGTITGTVTDARTGAPLANIEVSIFNGTATDEVFTTTNASGVYTLSGVNPTPTSSRRSPTTASTTSGSSTPTSCAA
jgi:hypothetical protein